MEINGTNQANIRFILPPSPPGARKPAVPAPETQDPKMADAPEATRLTPPEEDYFASAFPAAAKAIRQHVLYQKTGPQQFSSLGSVIDRKG